MTTHTIEEKAHLIESMKKYVFIAKNSCNELSDLLPPDNTKKDALDKMQKICNSYSNPTSIDIMSDTEYEQISIIYKLAVELEARDLVLALIKHANVKI